MNQCGEDGQHGMQAVPGGSQPIGGSVRKKDDGEGLTYRERQKDWVDCGDCGKEMTVGSLVSHQVTQDRKDKEKKWSWNASAMGGDVPKTYWIEFQRTVGYEGLPSGGLPRKGWDMDGDEDAFLQPARL